MFMVVSDAKQAYRDTFLQYSYYTDILRKAIKKLFSRRFFHTFSEGEKKSLKFRTVTAICCLT